jgi:hypothetical protein
MEMFLLNKTFVEKLDKHRRRFFWAGRKKKAYWMVKWKKVCKSKDKGGAGVKDLRKQNISFLTKWRRMLETQDGLGQRIVRQKCMRNKTMSSVKPRFNDSPCWKALLKVKEHYLQGERWC